MHEWKFLFFYAFLLFADFFSITTFFKNLPGISFDSVSNSLDPDLAQQSVGPGLGPSCMQMLSAKDIGRKRVKL